MPEEMSTVRRRQASHRAPETVPSMGAPHSQQRIVALPGPLVERVGRGTDSISMAMAGRGVTVCLGKVDRNALQISPRLESTQTETKERRKQ